MKLTLEMAVKYADAADALISTLHRRLDELKGELPRGPSGSVGYRTVAGVAKHLKKRELQIDDARAQIAELESTDTASDMVLEIAGRIGLSV